MKREKSQKKERESVRCNLEKEKFCCQGRDFLFSLQTKVLRDLESRNNEKSIKAFFFSTRKPETKKREKRKNIRDVFEIVFVRLDKTIKGLFTS